MYKGSGGQDFNVFFSGTQFNPQRMFTKCVYIHTHVDTHVSPFLHGNLSKSQLLFLIHFLVSE